MANDTVVVYRIEDRNGFGPFRGDGLVTGQWNHFPTPYCELGIYMSGSLHSAVTQIDHLILWFGHPLVWQHLKDAGYFLSAYQTDPVDEGRYQVVFDKEQAKLLFKVKL